MIVKVENWWKKEPFKPNSNSFNNLPQYHFNRDEMCEVFDAEFMDWFWDHIGEKSDDFYLFKHDDEFYILHLPSGTMINWYKHMGRTNTCNKNLSIEDLKEFKKMLLDDFGYEYKEK